MREEAERPGRERVGCTSGITVREKGQRRKKNKREAGSIGHGSHGGLPLLGLTDCSTLLLLLVGMTRNQVVKSDTHTHTHSTNSIADIHYLPSTSRIFVSFRAPAERAVSPPKRYLQQKRTGSCPHCHPNLFSSPPSLPPTRLFGQS